MRPNTYIFTQLPLLLAFVLTAAAHDVHAADFATQASQDAVLKEVGVDEKPDAMLPPGLTFTDQDGKAVKLGDFFADKKPVLLSLNYYLCPMLCPVTFANLTRTIGGMKGLAPGRDFKVLVVSVNPDETPELAKEKAKETYKMVSAPDPESWWRFLLGKQESIDALTKAVGFRFKKLDAINIAHPSVLIVLTPEGRVSRYLYGIEHTPGDLRLAVIEAADGKVGASEALNRVLLFCYHYDPVGRKYALAATNIMKGAGVLVLAGLGVMAFFMLRHERGRKTDA